MLTEASLPCKAHKKKFNIQKCTCISIKGAVNESNKNNQKKEKKRRKITMNI
jgi:hypothetical protein